MKYELRENYEVMFDNIVALGAEYVYGHQLESMVLGISGGIDSAVTTILANAICRKLADNFNYQCKLVGVVMPIESNKKEETVRGLNVCTTFCDLSVRPDLYQAFITIMEQLNGCAEEQDIYKWDCGCREEGEDIVTEKGILVRRGNIKARLRMMQLYHLANKYKGIVLSTDNLTELMLGFWTLHGDVGDLGLIQSLWKTEVYGLARWMVDNGYGGEDGEVLQPCINAVPTDGLGVSESDFDQLGYGSYEEIDNKLIEMANLKYEDKSTKHLENDPVIKRWANTTFKRENPYNIKRKDIVGFHEDTEFI